MIRLARKIHRIVSYLVFIQVTLWIAGGLTFAVLPFDSVVKGGAVTAPPSAPTFPENWVAMLAPHQRDPGQVKSIASHNSSQGLLLELKGEELTRWVRMSDGAEAVRPDAAEIGNYAQQLYAGEGVLQEARFVDEPEYRYLGLVDEMYGQTNVWLVSFDDAYGSRLYFDGATGRYLTVRNDFWVFYDAMWRLHIMDYKSGEDFNNTLLLVFTLLTLVFTISGLVLTVSALQRSLSRR